MSVFPKNLNVPYKGEIFVWDKFNEYLPKEYVSYHNQAIGLKEADVILLCPGKGVLILEIKGYLAKNIINVPDNNTIIRKNSPADLSPLKQARNYMFMLNKEFEENDLQEVYVVPSVAYPFITLDEFYEKGLDKVSNEKITFLSEDFESFDKFKNKADSIFDLAFDQLNNPNKVKNCFNSNNFQKVRKYFEGSTYVEEIVEDIETPVMEEDLFSRLIYVNNKEDYSDEFYDKTISNIFNGVETYFYSKDDSLIADIKNKVKERLFERGVVDNKEFIKNGNLVNNHFYNIECVDIESDSFEITNGEVLDKIDLLKKLDKKCNFNFNQFSLEHAPSEDIIVSAGAGTGKTYSLISRINYLIWKHKYTTDELIEKLVMITFTNEAANSMKKKIQEFFLNKQMLTKNVDLFRYYECIEDMKVSTIDSLAKALVKKYSIALGLGCDYKIVSGVYVKSEIVKSLVNKYIKDKNLENKLNLPNYRLVKRILSLISKLDNKNIDVTLDDVMFGDSKDKILNNLFMSIIKDYQEEIKKYEKENNCIFLSELIKTLKNLVSNNSIFKEFSIPEIDYLIVDEFQDTDDVQINIMCQFAELFKFKFFVVGDIKQCIYRFRGAEVKAFDTLKEKRQKVLTYTLNKNYRTDKDVLASFNDIFSNWNKKRVLTYSDDDKLIGCKEFKDNGIYCLEGNVVDNLVSLLKEIVSENKNESTAILVRYNYQIEEIKNICKEHNIAIQTEIGGDLFKIDPTIDFYKLIQAIKYSNNVEYIYNLFTTSYVSDDLPKKVLLEKEDKDSLIKYFNDNPPIKDWNKYISDIRKNPVLKVLRDLINNVRPWDNIAKKDFIPEEEKEHIRESYRKNLDELFENLIEKSNSDYLTINNISNYLEVMILTSQEKESRASYHRKSEGNNIICTTVHKSKGLEYDNVILPYCDFNIELKRAQGDVDVIVSKNKVGIRIKLSDNFGDEFSNNYHKEFAKEEFKDRKEEETRILYVAMTRTIKNLYYLTDESKYSETWGSLIKGE